MIIIDITLLGLPVDYGADRRGTDMGPSALRYAHLQAHPERMGLNVLDAGNLDVPVAERSAEGDPQAKFLSQLERVWSLTADEAVGITEQGRVPLFLGGDHSISVGSIGGVARTHSDLTVLWFDAHGDFNDSDTTLSGNVHGMPVSLVTGRATADLLVVRPQRTHNSIAKDCVGRRA